VEIDTFSPDDVGVFLNAGLQVEPVGWDRISTTSLLLLYE
jgi:hypothetical protein